MVLRDHELEMFLLFTHACTYEKSCSGGIGPGKTPTNQRIHCRDLLNFEFLDRTTKTMALWGCDDGSALLW